MCWEQSHRQRTIAASRSDDNRDESHEKRDNSKLPTNPPRPTKKKQASRPHATVTYQPRRKTFRLDKLFQERSHRPTQCIVLVKVPRYGWQSPDFHPSNRLLGIGGTGPCSGHYRPDNQG